MRLYMQRLPDGSYQCYCDQYELNNHPFMVDKTLQALYDYCKEALQGRAEWDIEATLWQWADQPDTMDVSK
jgi:hypothetical protein